MMSDFQWVWIIAFVIAMAIGWLMGVFHSRKQKSKTVTLNSRHIEGLSLLIQGESDKEIESFIASLEVNMDTFDTHIALGNLLRQRGDVSSATRVHQNLVARKQLGYEQQERAQMELARDFVHAGLMDRAERLLQNMLESTSLFREDCLLALTHIYRDEGEWNKCIHTTELLMRCRKVNNQFELKSHCAQYCCEIAQDALGDEDYLTARKWIKKAISFNDACVRANMISGELELKRRQYHDAIEKFTKILDQDPEFIPEAIPFIKQSFVALGDRSGYRRFLEDCCEKVDSATVMLHLAEEVQEVDGDFAAAEFMGSELKKRPSMRGLSRLIDLHSVYSEGRSLENLQLLKSMIDELIQRKPVYQCNHCGFTGKQIHWQCPSCKHWESVRAIHGVEGD